MDTLGPQGASAPSEPAALALALERQFDRLGWCPHQFRRLQRDRSPATLRYLSTLDRRNYRSSHHGACHGRPCCVANNVNTTLYVTKHTQTCAGSCSFVAVDYSHVVDIIAAGGVPIVGIQVEPASAVDEPAFRLIVTPRTIATRYTVISHVWCDGLGNPFANALPTCQVQRLYHQLRSLPREHESSVFSVGSLQVDWWRQSFMLDPESQPPLFWMDTLCIPVHPEHAALRNKAINQMASIYAAAVQELVLDAELLQCEASNSPALDVLARMACSAWMTRSWTLQEGVLARECVFQFKDCAVDPTHEWCLYGPRPGAPTRPLTVSFPDPTDEHQWEVYEELYNVLWHTLHQDWKTSYRRDPPKPVERWGLWDLGRPRVGHPAEKVYQLPAVEGLPGRDGNGRNKTDRFMIQLGKEHRLKQLVDTWNELAHRSTTMPEDLHVIIANLLDFNADSIMRLPTREERMRAMVLSFELLPISLFYNTGPKWCDNIGAVSNNQWIPIEPSKSELSLTPVMNVTAEWLELDLQRGAMGTRIVLLHENGSDVTEQSAFLCSTSSRRFFDVTLHYGQSRKDKINAHSDAKGALHYLIVEDLTLPAAVSAKGAVLRGFPSSRSDRDGVIRLSYVCPVTLRLLARQVSPDEEHIAAEILPLDTKIAVKYDPIPDFTSHPRRLTRGPTFQGGVAIVMLLPIPIVTGIACMAAFIITMARPPHAFTPTAKGLLAAFLILHFGSSLAAAAWLFFLSMWLYRMWLASFESEWVPEEQAGWWASYVRLERWLSSVEYAAVTRVMRGVRRLRGRFVVREGRGVDGQGP
ncbi:het domain protein [Stagonosporopsis vannaccii]|nr:het domain protein [Stagonosporopsis vannaccii]